MERFYKKWFNVLSLPAIILFVGVILIPFIIGVLYSFTAWRGSYFVGGDHWWQSFVGLENYIKAFKSKEFLGALWYSVKYTVLAVIVINVVALAMALMVQKVLFGKGFFRSVLFLPNLLGSLALGFIWSFIIENVFTEILFGPEGVITIPFLQNLTQDSNRALVAFLMMSTWKMAGYMMIIYLTGLNNISKDLYEAADIDGANAFHQFKNITVPMLMPSFTVVLFMTLSNSFKMLDENVALTDGNFSTRMLPLQIIKTTSDTQPPDYGFAQAQAVIFFILIAAIALIQVNVTKKKEVEA